MSGMRNFWVRTALILSLLVPVYFLIAALGAKFGLFDWRTGFVLMTLRLGIFVLMGTAAFAFVGLVLSLLVSPRQGWKSALLALLIPGIGLGYGLWMKQNARAIPPIHDISTDLANPPAFSHAVLSARAAVPDGNAIESNARMPNDPDLGPLAGLSVADVQRRAYSDIRPIEVSAAPDQAFDRALAAARAQGWRIGMADRAAGRFEATVQSFWYGFTDDMAVRVTPVAGHAIIDVRSVSRVGMSDLGANAKRVRQYRDALNQQGG